MFHDLLDVKLKGVAHISYHLMSQYTDWRGLAELHEFAIGSARDEGHARA